jgi:AcrR family transcriptional regulator
MQGGPNTRGSSEDTRRRLLDAALDAFGRYGFDGASTRRIASDAGVNLAAIPYHYGGKEGLHRAVAQHIVDEVSGRLGPLADTVSHALDAGDVSPDEAGAMLQTMVGQAAETILGHPEARRWAPFILREQMDPSSTFDVLYEGFMGRAHKLITALLARAIGKSKDDQETIAGAFAVLGQLVIFRMGPAIIERRLGWTEYGPGEIEIVRTILHENLAAIIAAGRAS